MLLGNILKSKVEKSWLAGESQHLQASAVELKSLLHENGQEHEMEACERSLALDTIVVACERNMWELDELGESLRQEA